MLPRLQSDGDVWFRPTYNNHLLPTDSGFLYVMHLLGELKPKTSSRGRGRPQNNALISYAINRDGQPAACHIKGFCNEARSDYKEVYSWIPVPTDDGWQALAVDFSGIKAVSQSYLARTLLIPLENRSGKAKVLDLRGESGNHWVIAPRLHHREASREFIFLAKSKKHYQLQRLQF